MRKKIGLIVGEQDATYSSILVSNIYEEAKKYDYDVFVFANYGTYDRGILLYSEGEMSVYKIPSLDSFAGFIIDETLFNIDDMPKTVYDYFSAKSHCPVVYLKGQSERFYDIKLADKQAIKDMTTHFIKVHGFTDICHMTGRWELQDARERFHGYEEAMEEAGIDITSDMVFYGNYWTTLTQEAADFFTKNRERVPQAIVCANDFMAIALANELIARGYKIPEDICISGFDNEGESYTNSIPITTADPSINKFGKLALKTLHKAIIGENPPKTQYVSATPVYRQSCGCGFCQHSNPLEETYKRMTRHYDGIDTNVFMFSAYQVAFDIDGILNNADFYYKYNHADHSYICLCDDAFCAEDRPIEKTNEYTHNMILKRIFYKDPTKNYDSPDITFERKDILPKEYLDTPEPNLLFVYPIHCQNKCLGYIVSSYPKNEWPYHFTQSYTVALGNAINDYNVRNKYLGLEEIKKMYLTDELTGIKNRRGYEQDLNLILDRAQRRILYVAIAIIDMDGLKYINDNHGHKAGDECLKAVARALSSVTGNDETAARYGGDEFAAILISENNPKRSSTFESDFEKALTKEAALMNVPYTIHASVGVVDIPANSTASLSSFFQKADDIMYFHKAEYKKSLKNAKKDTSSND